MALTAQDKVWISKAIAAAINGTDPAKPEPKAVEPKAPKPTHAEVAKAVGTFPSAKALRAAVEASAATLGCKAVVDSKALGTKFHYTVTKSEGGEFYWKGSKA